jgi:hypothetical protein
VETEEYSHEFGLMIGRNRKDGAVFDMPRNQKPGEGKYLLVDQ